MLVAIVKSARLTLFNYRYGKVESGSCALNSRIVSGPRESKGLGCNQDNAVLKRIISLIECIRLQTPKLTQCVFSRGQ